jgi:DNA uptake protein ComE-like DNA-binding protein
MEEGKKTATPRNSFTVGAIALVFLIIGYEVALFVHKAAVTRIVADRDRPDTVYVVDRALAEEVLAGDATADEDSPGRLAVRRQAGHAPEAVRVREKAAPRRVETFRFNPNTVSLEDLMRLGFSEKQAQSILNYRAKGGRYRRPSDFAKSYVVADSVFERLEPYIDIPKIDINRGDSTAFETLPGIGPYFAGKMVSYRKELRGYSHPEQLMDIYHFDREKYDGLKDLITCSSPEPYPIWSLPEAELARHPYLSKAEAHSIVLYRTHQPRASWTLEGILKAGILSEEHGRKLSRCVLAKPE